MTSEKESEASLPVKQGAMGLNSSMPVYGDEQFNTSKALSDPIVRKVLYNNETTGQDSLNDIRTTIYKNKQIFWRNTRSELIEGANQEEKRRWEERSSSGSVLRLHALPLKRKPLLNLPKAVFQDALRLRLNITPHHLPRRCPGMNCNQTFSLQHDDSCAAGGTTIRRHDHIKMIMANYAEKASGVALTTIEPARGPLEGSTKELINGNVSYNARADLCIQDLSQQHILSFINICVISPTCPTNVPNTVSKSILNAENKKIKDRGALCKQMKMA